MIEHNRLAHQLKIILVGKLILINKNRSSNPNLLLELSQGMLVVKENMSLRWSEMPLFQYISDRIGTVKSTDGFSNEN